MTTTSVPGRGSGGGRRFGIEEAVLVAVEAHRGQVDKDGRPYVLHPLRVMHGFPPADEDAQIVAVLHDVVEDTAMTLDELRNAGLEPELADAVDLLTHRRDVPNSDYWATVATNPLARRVKIADVADNSLPERLAALDPATASRLATKYRLAMKALGVTGTVAREASDT